LSLPYHRVDDTGFLFCTKEAEKFTVMMKVISFLFEDDAHALIAFDIRRKVFVEEQHVSREEEYDEFEKTSTHYLVYADETPVGTARWRKTEGGIKLERFAVLKEYRNSGAGSAVLKKVLEDVIPLKEKIYLNAQITALNFYLKAGFVIEGDEFAEANIRHYKMVLKQK
jgi:predicted GNAT family N-acyltransferase